jgi:phospholipase C
MAWVRPVEANTLSTRTLRPSAEPRPQAWRVAAVAAVIGILVAVPLEYYFVENAPSGPTNGPTSAEWKAFASHIDHIVFLVLENHAYDSYFGAYCPALGPYCPSVNNGIAPGTCVLLDDSQPNGACVKPFNFTAANWSIHAPLPHNEVSSLAAWNGGLMNGFYAAENSGLTPFGHYNATTAPLDWDLAEEYGLSDDFFSSILSYSLPNHWHIVAGQAPQQIVGNFTAIDQGATVAGDHKYLNQANSTRSIEDLLLGSNVSWKYYDYTLGTYSEAIQVPGSGGTGGSGGPFEGQAYNYWNPQAAKAESYNESFISHYVTNTAFFGDARNGSLPAISWVIPAGQDSDHPPDNSTLAQSFTASVVDAVESSPEWNRTALFITWDDYGGFYDGVPPPQVDAGQQLGFRVPLLVISPYTPADYIGSSMGYFESILHLMEWRFQLGCITELDCNAPLPLNFFDFGQAPRAPMLFPTTFSDMVYPIVPASLAAHVPVGAYYPPSNFTYFPDGEAPDID